MKTFILLISLLITNVLIAQEWVVQHEGESFSLTSVHFTDKNNGFAVGGLLSFFTSDGGETWIQVDTLGIVKWRKVTGPKNSNTIYTCGLNGQIGKLENGTFTLLNSGTNKILNGLTFPTENTGYAVGEDGIILKTTNAGITWTEQNSGTSEWLTNISSSDTDCVVAVGDNGTILQTTNGGENWVNKSDPNIKVYLSGVMVNSLFESWISGSEGVIIRIRRDTLDTFTIETGDGIMALGFVDPSVSLGVGDNGVVVSFDGEQWKIETSNTSAWLNDVHVIVEGKSKGATAYIYAVGTSGTIIKKTMQIVNVDETLPIKSFYLSQSFPNPFNPTTTINFSLANSEFVTLKVYDVLGKEITTLVNEELNAGQHIKIFNAENLSSGVYFYKLQAGKFSETKKMMLIR